jgi:hypothetical protein
MSGFRRPAAVFVVSLLCWLAGGSAGSAQPATPENNYNEQMLRMTPQQQAAKLASFLGLWCVGTQPFYMGMTKSGAAKGYAYWSITCAGGKSYFVQLQPDGTGAAADCAVLKAQGEGRECYKTF